MTEHVFETVETDGVVGVVVDGSMVITGVTAQREEVVRCRDCAFCELVPGGSTCFCRKFYEKPDWGLPENYAGSEPCEMAEVDFDGFCKWGERRVEAWE